MSNKTVRLNVSQRRHASDFFGKEREILERKFDGFPVTVTGGPAVSQSQDIFDVDTQAIIEQIIDDFGNTQDANIPPCQTYGPDDLCLGPQTIDVLNGWGGDWEAEDSGNFNGPHIENASAQSGTGILTQNLENFAWRGASIYLSRTFIPSLSHDALITFRYIDKASTSVWRAGLRYLGAGTTGVASSFEGAQFRVGFTHANGDFMATRLGSGWTENPVAFNWVVGTTYKTRITTTTTSTIVKVWEASDVEANAVQSTAVAATSEASAPASIGISLSDGPGLTTIGYDLIEVRSQSVLGSPSGCSGKTFLTPLTPTITGEYRTPLIASTITEVYIDGLPAVYGTDWELCGNNVCLIGSPVNPSVTARWVAA